MEQTLSVSNLTSYPVLFVVRDVSYHISCLLPQPYLLLAAMALCHETLIPLEPGAQINSSFYKMLLLLYHIKVADIGVNRRK